MMKDIKTASYSMTLDNGFFLRMLTLGLLGVMLSACFSVSTGDGKSSGAAVVMNPEEKIQAFAAANFERLKEDMVRGQGDRLSALALLLGIPQEQQAEFFTFTQEKFSVLCPSPQVTSDEMVTRLIHELASYSQIHRILALN